ncbi:glycoside hydrolase domain-containing protein [Euzebya tangerina]|uniref:glycoside hydrolase domain-containing protein n=1 Tax=Euzebya tangerina TaxID=591198 RepID=UPI000E30FC8D|nr:glycoside hydrolase domain-containing protein [Euzebya tangerina]
MRIEDVDPFIGSEPADLPDPDGLAGTWWWPKPPIGNTHPGATHPFGMVSVCPTSGAYPTGYGRYDRSTEGVPPRLHDDLVTSGFTHFHQSGTGAIRKYYNYLRVTPMTAPLDDLGARWRVTAEAASPGWYQATLDNGIICDLTVGPRSAVHRYTFPATESPRVVLDCAHGGLAIDQGETVPLRGDVAVLDPASAAGTVVMEGVPVSFHATCDAPDWRLMPWYDRRLMYGGAQLRFDAIRPTTLRRFGVIWVGPPGVEVTVEIQVGLSLRGIDQAAANLAVDLGQTTPRTITTRPDRAGIAGNHGREVTPAFATRLGMTATTWQDHLDLVTVEGGDATRRSVFATALYHSLIKPCMAGGESPFWDGDGPFAFDISTMWDLYRTHLPLLTTLLPRRATELAMALITVCEFEGNFPIGYRMARGADRFTRQGSALAHTFLADLCALKPAALDWNWAVSLMASDLTRLWGEEYIEQGLAHPVTHTLDLGLGYHCTAQIARRVGDPDFAERLEGLATNWVNAYDPTTGLVIDSQYYEGGRWNYSFRLLHDMAQRIRLAGGDDRFVTILDTFFGQGADPVEQLGVAPKPDQVAAGYALNRFEGLNNEPDMDAPWCYHHAGRPDRTADIVRDIVDNQFDVGRGGLPGNDDSGGLSSWYVWACVGLFPQPGQQSLLVGPPAFPHVEITVDDGQAAFVIDAPGADDVDQATGRRLPRYVTGARLDGRPLERAWLSTAEVAAGGHLVLDLSPEPAGWGAAHRPPSLTPHGAAP